jgi:hypothetical protein
MFLVADAHLTAFHPCHKDIAQVLVRKKSDSSYQFRSLPLREGTKAKVAA